MTPQDLSGWRHAARGLIACAMLACSCSHSVEAPPGNLAWLTTTAASARLVATGDSVASSLTVTNDGDTTQTLQYAPCTFHGPLSLRAYRSGASTPAWDSALDDNGACFATLLFVDLKPGASYTFTQTNAISEILGDSLPAAAYTFTVSGAFLTPTDTAQLGMTTLTLAVPSASASAVTLTTDQQLYVATASGAAPYMRYAVTVIATYRNAGAVPVYLETCSLGSPFLYYVLGAGNNVGQFSAFSPNWGCVGGLPPVMVAAGAVRVDTLRLNGPSTTQADGTPIGPLNGQVQLAYYTGTGCANRQPECVQQTSNIFAIQIPK